MIFHWTQVLWWPWIPAWFSGFARAGYLGVDIFFILSGAVIAFTAVGRTWDSFAKARFLRLFPAYFLVMVNSVSLSGYRGTWDPGAEDFLSFGGLQLWLGSPSYLGVAWTLFYEVGFYALIATLMFVRKGLTESILRHAVFGFLLLSIAAVATDNAVLKFFSLNPFSGFFAFGVLLGISRSWLDLRRNALALLTAAALAYLTLVERTNELVDLGLPVFLQVLLIVCVLMGSAAVIVWSTMRPVLVHRRPRVAAAVTTLALMTYPLYLVHQDFGLNLVRTLQDAGVHPYLSALTSAIVVVTFSWVSVRFFEPWARNALRSVLGWNERRTPPAHDVDERSAAQTS